MSKLCNDLHWTQSTTLVIHDLDSLFHDEKTISKHIANLMESGLRALDELKSSGDIQAYGMGINRKGTAS